MAIFRGAGVAIVTPMHADGTVNYEKLDEFLEFQIANGTDAVIICGTTGEASTLSHEEHMEAIKFTVEQVKGRIPVIGGTGSNSTETAIMMSEMAASYGVDGVLLVTPYYNKATQKGLAGHFTAIANAIPSVPVILYDVPGRTGCSLAPETVASLVKNVSNIVGLKAASGNLSQIARTMALADGNLDLYSGNDDQILPVLSLGGIGVISVLSNVAPRQAHDIVMSYLNGDPATATKLQLAAIDLCDALFCEVNPIPVKTALNMMGWDVGPLRMPLCEMDPAHAEKLRKALQDYGVLA